MDSTGAKLEITSLATLDQFIKDKKSSKNAVYMSEVPEVCKEYPCIVGIDEAGRGPVLGPMVYGIACCPMNEGTLPDQLGCADSKALKEEDREKIFKKICDNSLKMGYAIEIIAPATISTSMLSRSKRSLNDISMDSAIYLVKEIASAGVKIKHVYVDTVGPPEKYQAYLKCIFPDYDITVAKQADSTYGIVSAASICAKVARDHALLHWKCCENVEVNPDDLGSGYSGDPVTKKFLLSQCDPIFGFPDLVRFSWSTATDALREAYHVEWDDSEESAVKAPANVPSITSFFKMLPGKNKKRHEFFTLRGLSRKVEF